MPKPFRTTLLYLGIALSVAAGAGCSGCKKKKDDPSEPKLTTPGKVIAIPAARGAYVTNNASDTLSVIDRDGDGVEVVPVDLEKDAHEAPHHLAIDAATKTVFVALSFPPEPSKKKDPHASHGNGSENGLLAKLDLGTLAIVDTREVDENPGDVLLTHDKTRVLVSHFDMKRAMDVAAKGGGSPSTMFAHVVVFDARDMKKLGSRAVCVAPHGMVLTRDDKTAFVACYGSDEIGVVDMSAKGFPVSRIPLGASQGVPGVPRYGPYSVTLSPDESVVVVADLEGQDIRVFDRKEKRFLSDKTVPLAAKAFMPAFISSTVLLVPLQTPDGLARVDIATSKVERRTTFTKDVCGLPHAMRIAKDGRAYLVCEGDHQKPGSVLEIDRETLDVKKRWAVGAYPDGIAFGDE